MILRRLTCNIEADGITANVIEFKNVVRVVAIAVCVADNGGGFVTVGARWRLLSKDGNLTLPVLAAQSDVNPGVAPAERWIIFMPNQQRQAAIPDGAQQLEISPAYLPPDFWVLPSEQIKVEVTGGNPGPTMTQCIVSFLDKDDDEG